MARCNRRHHKRHRRNRIIYADELLKKTGFKMPSQEVLRLWREEGTADVPLEIRLQQFGPLSPRHGLG